MLGHKKGPSLPDTAREERKQWEKRHQQRTFTGPLTLMSRCMQRLTTTDTKNVTSLGRFGLNSIFVWSALCSLFSQGNYQKFLIRNCGYC